MWWMIFVRLPRRWAKPLDRRHKGLSSRLRFSFSFKHGRVIELSFIISGIGSFTSFLCPGRFFQLIKAELGENSWTTRDETCEKIKTVWKVPLKTVWKEVPLCCLSECRAHFLSADYLRANTRTESGGLFVCALCDCVSRTRKRGPKDPQSFRSVVSFLFCVGSIFLLLWANQRKRQFLWCGGSGDRRPSTPCNLLIYFKNNFQNPPFLFSPLNIFNCSAGSEEGEERRPFVYFSLFTF